MSSKSLQKVKMEPQATVEFCEEFSVLHSCLSYADKKINGGLINFEGVNGKIIRLITQPLEELFTPQDASDAAELLEESSLNSFKSRIIYIFLMKSGLLPKNPAYLAIMKDLPELSVACVFQIIDICDFYPHLFKILSNSAHRGILVYSALVNHLQLWPQEKQSVVMGRLAEHLFLSDTSPLLYQLETLSHMKEETQEGSDTLKKALQVKVALKDEDDMGNVYQLLSCCLPVFEACALLAAMEEECQTYEVQMLLSLCAISLCIGQGFMPAMKRGKGDRLVVDKVRFSHKVVGVWKDEEVEAMYHSVLATNDFVHMAPICDMSVYEDQVVTIMEMIIEHVQDRLPEFAALTLKSWANHEGSAVTRVKGASSSVSRCKKGQPGHEIPVCYTESLLMQAQSQPGKVTSFRIRESMKKIANKIHQLGALDEDQKLAVNIFRVQEQLPGAKEAFLEVLSSIHLRDALNCVTKNVDLLCSFEAISILVRTLMNAKNRGEPVREGPQLLLEVFSQLSAQVQTELLWNLHGNYNVSDLFPLDDNYNVQLTSVFNQLTENDYQNSCAQIGVLAVQSAEQTLGKILEVAMASLKQQDLLLRILRDLSCLCFLKKEPTYTACALLQIITAKIDKGFLGRNEEMNFIGFVVGLIKPYQNEYITYSTQPANSLLSMPSLLDQCLLPLLNSLVVVEEPSEKQLMQLHACVHMVAAGADHKEMTSTFMLLTMAKVVNSCINSWRMSSPLVAEVKDKAVDVIREFVPILRKEVVSFPEDAIHCLWIHMEGFHWTVPYYFWELAWAFRKTLCWPSCLGMVASRKDIDLSFEVMDDHADGLLRLLELLQSNVDVGKEVMCPSIWSFPFMYPRLLNAVVQVLPGCSHREMGYIVAQLCVHIEAGWLVVETESILPAVEGLGKGSCVKLQVAQLLNDILWTVRNAYVTGHEEIVSHIAKGIYPLYQRDILSKVCPFVTDETDSKTSLRFHKGKLQGHVGSASGSIFGTIVKQPKVDLKFARYILAHCYIQIARQSACLGGSAVELRHNVLLEIAKWFVSSGSGLFKDQTEKVHYLQLLAALVKATSEVQLMDQVALLKTLAWEEMKEQQKSLYTEKEVFRQLNPMNTEDVQSEDKTSRRWRPKVDLVTTGASNVLTDNYLNV